MHTADVGLSLEAPSLERLLAAAVEGLGRILAGDASVPRHTRLTLEVEAPDPALLLRNALRSALQVHDAEGFTPSGASAVVTAGSSRWRAVLVLEGGRMDAAPATEIKGVTLHRLRAVRTPAGRWEGSVVFDV